MRIVPQLPRICLQQECSTAVIRAPGAAHIIVGANIDRSTASATTVREKMFIPFSLTSVDSRKQASGIA
jgi:hypothetical protein